MPSIEEFEALTGLKGTTYTGLLKEEKEMPKIKIEPLCFVCQQPFCESCYVCETFNCTAVGTAVSSRGQAIELGVLKPRTQKALGYQMLSKSTELSTPQPFFIINDEADIDAMIRKAQDNFQSSRSFAVRPCPVTPRHGFVETRFLRVDEFDQVKGIFAEAQKADPEAELLVCVRINALANAVITPARLAIGPGHDGATSGRDSIEFPLLGVPFPELSNDILERAGISNDQSPYLEAVAPYLSMTSMWSFTQLRAGPKMAGLESDFIPSKLKVERILEASGDLLVWEQQTQSISPGTVVVHKGGSLISHYGVHCIINNVPIMTSRIPSIGEWLEPSGEARKAFNPDAVLRGLEIGLSCQISTDDQGIHPGQLVQLLLVALHNAPAMTNGYGIWIGIAAASMMRVGTAAAHGEARHNTEVGRQTSRSRIYHGCFKEFFPARVRLKDAQESFLYDSWRSNYGGKAWAECTGALIELDWAIVRFLATPDHDHIVEIIEALNQVVNKAHNNGWWLNKFTGTDSAFDDAARQSLIAITAAASGIFNLKGYLALPVGPNIEIYRKAEGIIIRGPNEVVKKVEEDSSEDDDDDDGSEEPLAPEEPEPPNEEEGSYDGCNCDTCKKWNTDQAKYAAETAQVAKELPNKSEDEPEPQPSKLKKILFDPSKMEVKAAHARYECVPSALGVHLQLKIAMKGADESSGYVSRDFSFAYEKSKEFRARLVEVSSKMEQSYSSDAGGYFNCEIDTSTEGVLKIIDSLNETDILLTTVMLTPVVVMINGESISASGAQ